jgi:mono/diheme cytochrome c family protein
MNPEGTLRVIQAASILATILLPAWLHRADAQEAGNVANGRRLSETWCSSCHLVGPGSTRGVSNGAPTFAAIAHEKSVTLPSLQVFLQTPHANMPDLHLSRAEIDNLAAYILSLRQG